MTNKPAVTRIIKDPRQIRQSITQILTDAYRKAKRRTRSKWKQHARPMTWRELRDLARVDYQAYLQTEHWGRTRRKELERTGYHCESCGFMQSARGPLQVHHLSYKRLGRERPRDLRVLCGECHAREHGK